MFLIGYLSEAQQKLKEQRGNFVEISENQTDFVSDSSDCTCFVHGRALMTQVTFSHSNAVTEVLAALSAF